MFQFDLAPVNGREFVRSFYSLPYLKKKSINCEFTTDFLACLLVN